MRRVARVLEPGKLEILDLEHTVLGLDQARLQIEAVGICGSDVALMAGTHPYAVYPVIPGHELGGRVLEVSAGSQFKPGQRVAVRPTLSCGVCPSCRDDHPNHCPEIRVLGVHLDGGMADEIVDIGGLCRHGGTDSSRGPCLSPSRITGWDEPCCHWLRRHWDARNSGGKGMGL